jgi:hypothetical protein
MQNLRGADPGPRTCGACFFTCASTSSRTSWGKSAVHTESGTASSTSSPSVARAGSAARQPTRQRPCSRQTRPPHPHQAGSDTTKHMDASVSSWQRLSGRARGRVHGCTHSSVRGATRTHAHTHWEWGAGVRSASKRTLGARGGDAVGHQLQRVSAQRHTPHGCQHGAGAGAGRQGSRRRGEHARTARGQPRPHARRHRRPVVLRQRAPVTVHLALQARGAEHLHRGGRRGAHQVQESRPRLLHAHAHTDTCTRSHTRSHSRTHTHTHTRITRARVTSGRGGVDALRC